MKGLTDIPGIKVGHATDLQNRTGCTAILTEAGAVAGMAIRGSATGTEEFELLRPGHVTDRIHAVVFAGGSAFGLETASGVRLYLEQKGVGFPTGAGKVPLVPAAILYDLGFAKHGVRPSREMGKAAAAAATDAAVQEGAVGAGTGATVGKLLGATHMMKSGVGSASTVLGNGARVAALAVVNAFGDVIDPKTGAIIAGARKTPDGREFVNTAQAMKAGLQGGFQKENTTLVAVATDARLDKVQATKLAEFSTIGMARTISPVFTMSDGDVAIALSLGEKKAAVDALGVAAAEVVAEAILRAVREAPTMNGVPGLKG